MHSLAKGSNSLFRGLRLTIVNPVGLDSGEMIPFYGFIIWYLFTSIYELELFMHLEQFNWSLIFLFAFAQGLFLAVLLLLKNRRGSHNILASIVLSYSLLLAFYVACWNNMVGAISNWILLANTLTYILGPLYYLYITTKRFSFSTALHFLPALVFAIICTVSILMGEWLMKNMLLTQVMHLLAYMVLIHRHLASQISVSRWLNTVAFSLYMYALGFTIYTLLELTDLLRVEHDYFISLMSSSFIYYVGYKGFLMDELTLKAKKDEFTLSKALSKTLMDKLNRLVIDEQLFLRSDFKIGDLGVRTGIPTYVISQVINVEFGNRFNQWVNNFRIEHAKHLIREYPNEKFIVIAYRSGFNNKVSFIHNFKKYEGITPSDYRNLHFGSRSTAVSK